jgi:hypothetical protein
MPTVVGTRLWASESRAAGHFLLAFGKVNDCFAFCSGHAGRRDFEMLSVTGQGGLSTRLVVQINVAMSRYPKTGRETGGITVAKTW